MGLWVKDTITDWGQSYGGDHASSVTNVQSIVIPVPGCDEALRVVSPVHFAANVFQTCANGKTFFSFSLLFLPTYNWELCLCIYIPCPPTTHPPHLSSVVLGASTSNLTPPLGPRGVRGSPRLFRPMLWSWVHRDLFQILPGVIVSPWQP